MPKELFIGLDVHAETIAGAVVEGGRGGEVRYHGAITNTAEALKRLCGRLHRAGELTAIWTSDEEHEAMRDLIRARQQTQQNLRAAKQQLLSFMLRHGLRYPGKIRWTKPHWRWLSSLRGFACPHQQLAFEEYKRAIRQIETRVATLDTAIAEAVSRWHFGDVVEALRALRGVGTIIAASLVAEIGNISRFESPRQLMAWLGLVPSEHSSGSKTRRGRITRMGNTLGALDAG